MGFLILITFIFLRTENSNAETSLPIITLKNSGIIDINNEPITTTILPNQITTITNSEDDDDVILETENIDNLNTVTMASALVRSRREPPITIIKHRLRSIGRRPIKTRRRIKRPKVRYGPPNYNFGEPLSYYKQGADIFDSEHKINGNNNNNNDDLFDIQNFKKEFGSDFNIQSFELSDYDKQPIEVNFYGRGGRGGGKRKKQFYWSNDNRNLQNSQLQDDQGSGKNFWEQFAESPLIIPPKPSPFEVPSENNYTPPSQNNYQLTPQDNYQLPEQDIYQPFSKDTYNPPIQNNFHPHPLPPQTYQPLPNENQDKERYKFAEPPPNNIQWNINNYQPPFNNNNDNNPDYTSPQLPKTNIKLTSGGEFNGPKYLPPSEDRGKNFGEPNQNQNNNNGYFAEPPPINYNKYIIPGNDFALPLDESHKSPSYDYPKSSYEVPIYNSIPFNSNDATPVQQVIYPPNDIVYRSDYTSITPKISKESSNKIEITEQIKNFTNNNNNKNIQTFSTSLEELLEPPSDYLENISTKQSANNNNNRKQRKRNRIDSTNNNINKKKQHILDTDELREAFGSSSRIDNNSNLDSFPKEQTIRSNTKKRAPENFVLISSGNIENSGESSANSQNWEPIKIRENEKINNYQNNNNNQRINSSSSNSSNNDKKIKNTNRQIRYERTTENPFKNIQVISIEKSHSHSFYAGTMSPYEYELTQKYPGITAREDNGAVYVSSHINVGNDNSNNNDNIKRKGQVFNEELGNRNINNDELPKNHKYF